MIVHDVKQGSVEWQQLRAGVPTASEFSRILTPGGKPSASSRTYLHELVAERLMGCPLVKVTTAMMDRGHEMEPEAVAYYEFQNDVGAVQVGFITTDDGRIGASPDRLIGEDGLLEIKCPAPHTHIGYLLWDEAAKEYMPQLQGQLLVTGRAWVDICSYHPGLPTAVKRVVRDETYITLLQAALDAFCAALDSAMELLAERGVRPLEPQTEPGLGLTQTDIDWLTERVNA